MRTLSLLLKTLNWVDRVLGDESDQRCSWCHRCTWAILSVCHTKNAQNWITLNIWSDPFEGLRNIKGLDWKENFRCLVHRPFWGSDSLLQTKMPKNAQNAQISLNSRICYVFLFLSSLRLLFSKEMQTRVEAGAGVTPLFVERSYVTAFLN